MDVKAPLQQSHSRRYVWYVIFLLTIVNVFNYLDRMALAILAPLIKTDLELSDAQLGLLIGFAFALFYALCGIPIARWADRGVRRNIIAISLAVWSGMTALSGAAQNFWHLLIARVGVGAGEAGGYAPGSSIICDYVPLKRRPGAFAIHTFGLYAGMMVGLSLGGWLGQAIGWRWAFVALGIPGIALSIVVRFTLVEPVRGVLDARGDGEAVPSMGATIRSLWRCRTYRLLVLFLMMNGFAQYGFNQWWPSLYSRVFGLNLASLGIYLGIAIGIGSGMGLLIGGLLANKVSQRDARFPLTIGALATALAMPAALATLFVRAPLGSIMCVGLTAFLWCISHGPVVATETSVVSARVRATAVSIAVFLTSVFGFGLGPFCVGLVSDLLAPSLGVEALQYAMLLPSLLLPIMALVLYAAGKALPNDLKTARAHFADGLPDGDTDQVATWNDDRQTPACQHIASEPYRR